jgi:transposase
MRVAVPIKVNDTDRTQLISWSRGRSTPHRLVLRSKIVLMASEGLQNREIAEKLHAHKDVVGKWRNRFALQGMQGIIKDAPRPGRRHSISQKTVDRIIDTTLHEKPEGATHWSTRTLAKKLGVSYSAVYRVWKAHKIQPHRERGFKLSKDPEFNEKVTDIVGLYMNPPEKAAVICFDEKAEIQALDRSQTMLPVRPGMPASLSYTYTRNGTIDLFAAINVLDGTVVTTQFHKRHRHLEFLSFLRAVDENVPKGLQVHVVLDNLSSHKVDGWMKRHPRFQFHFTPTGASWLNMIEVWLGILTKQQIRRNSFGSVNELIDAINEFVATYQKNPRPFVWTVKADEILRKVARLRELQAVMK